MEIDKDIAKRVEDAFTSLEQIEKIKTSSLFNQNVLSKLESNPKRKLDFYGHTQSLQIALLLLVFLVNVSAILYSFSSQEHISDIEIFAQEYNFDSEDIFNTY